MLGLCDPVRYKCSNCSHRKLIMFIYRIAPINRVFLGFISMKWSMQIVSVTNPPWRKPNLCLQQILQPRRDLLISRRLETLIIDRKKSSFCLQHLTTDCPWLISLGPSVAHRVPVPSHFPPSLTGYPHRAGWHTQLWDAHRVLQGLRSFPWSFHVPIWDFRGNKHNILCFQQRGKGQDTVQRCKTENFSLVCKCTS